MVDQLYWPRTGSAGASGHGCSSSPRLGVQTAWTCTASRPTPERAASTRTAGSRRSPSATAPATRSASPTSGTRGAHRERGRSAPGDRRPDARRDLGGRHPDRDLPVRSGRPGRRSCSSTGPPRITRRSGSLAPALAGSFDLYAIDRRGRGASGDTLPYAIAREFEDLVAVARASWRRPAERTPSMSSATRTAGRCALGAALRTEAIGRVICYEGAPSPPGATYHPDGLDADLAAPVGRRRPRRRHWPRSCAASSG